MFEEKYKPEENVTKYEEKNMPTKFFKWFLTTKYKCTNF